MKVELEPSSAQMTNEISEEYWNHLTNCKKINKEEQKKVFGCSSNDYKNLSLRQLAEVCFDDCHL